MRRVLVLCLAVFCLYALPALAEPLPKYQLSVVQDIKGQKLSLDCTLAEPVDEATLRALGEKAYAENNGKKYQNVFIMWYLPHYQKGAGAWGITNFSGKNITVRIMALQG